MDLGRQRDLLEAAYTALESELATSVVVDRCVRLAQARSDWVNLWILRKETIDVDEQRARLAIEAEMLQRLGEDSFRKLKNVIGEDYIERRTLEREGEGKVVGLSIRQIEQQVAFLEMTLRRNEPPSQGLDSQSLQELREEYLGLAAKFDPTIRDLNGVLQRIRQRCQRFLVETEAAIGFAEVAGDAFARVRKVVDARLGAIAPQALEQFRSAYQRAAEGDVEARSQALTSCRRILVSLADALYPATGEDVVGADGKIRKMTEDRYMNRLLQYASEKIMPANARRLTQATVEELGARLDALNDLGSKGVHASVSPAEVDQCIVQTYMLAGDLLRLGDTEP